MVSPLYVEVMLCEPCELNVHSNAAVPPAQEGGQNGAPNGATVAGLPICVPPSKNVTVPPGPAALLLDEEIVAVRVT